MSESNSTPRPESEMLLKTPRIDEKQSRTHTRETWGTKTKASSRNVSRNTIPMTQKSWVTYNSPLWVRDRVKTEEELSHSMPTTPRILSRMEESFVNDAISTHTYSTRRKPIITPYDALSDKYAQAYFKSPFVKGIMERNKGLVQLKELKKDKTVNKLSVRRRCKATPNANKIKERESGFVNDAIITEKKRNKYKDIIPPYDASNDKLCDQYFQRADIKRLVNQTCTPRQSVPRKSVMT